ncbi:hypothetical protein [Bacillus vallismortis]|uniref:hypothetical protein n=1 Tax=Bacillus vallismortis TaxID=72361 RepID=UPI00227F4BF9|nr:hypothetical protein [Bacillus vallismortis]MCY7916799.1 hypothetical protein [Bacillus vallismortis]MCY8534248.1 hypothetical protein [Bacillus vallismortis]
MNFLQQMEDFDLYMHDLVKQHFEEHDKEIIELYSLLECLTNLNTIYPNIESNIIMDEVKTDLFSSIYLSTKGMYRNAFISLRSSLELGIGYLYFLDNNLDYIKWTKNKFDLSWSRLNDEKYGVLRVDYLKLFYETENLDEAYEVLIGKCNSNYRICSEYTHGKYGYMKTNLSTRYEYDEYDYKKFIDSYKEVVTCLIILQVIRFNKFLNNLNSEYLDDVEVILKSEGLKEILVYE